MIPTGTRIPRCALFAGQALVLVLLVASNRALFAPTTPVTKAKESKRPKTPRNVLRAEPLRIPAAEKQPLAPSLLDAVAGAVETPRPGIQPLPRTAFTQLTKPEYLKTDTPGSPHLPLSPPV